MTIILRLLLLLLTFTFQQAVSFTSAPAFLIDRQAYSSTSVTSSFYINRRHRGLPFGIVAAAKAPSEDNEIVVIGANGQTGSIITQILADRGVHVRAVTRSGLPPRRRRDDDAAKDKAKQQTEELVSYAKGDVTNYETIKKVLQPRGDKGAVPAVGGVVFAVTSSGDNKRGGNDVYDVDYKGAYNVAKACIEFEIPKFVMISAGCVTRPNALGSKVVNKLTSFTYGSKASWIDAKVGAETAVRDLYNNYCTEKKKKKKLLSSYTIIRPAAALSNKPALPVKDLCVLQGDLYSSAVSISRMNVAQLVVEALAAGTRTDYTTLDVCPSKGLYKNEEGNILDVIGMPTFHQKNVKGIDLPPELVHANAATYSDLLDGLVKDQDMNEKYDSIVSTYRGCFGEEQEDRAPVTVA